MKESGAVFCPACAAGKAACESGRCYPVGDWSAEEMGDGSVILTPPLPPLAITVTRTVLLLLAWLVMHSLWANAGTVLALYALSQTIRGLFYSLTWRVADNSLELRHALGPLRWSRRFLGAGLGFRSHSSSGLPCRHLVLRERGRIHRLPVESSGESARALAEFVAERTGWPLKCG